jgi:CRP-like cAMP-binding protein
MVSVPTVRDVASIVTVRAAVMLLVSPTTSPAAFPGTAAGFDALLDAARHEVYDEGEVLLAAGDSFDRLFLVADGALRVVLGTGAAGRPVQEVEEGSAFVARALLSGGPSRVSLVADVETSVLSLRSTAVLAFLDENPHLARQLEQVIDITEFGLQSAHQPLR